MASPHEPGIGTTSRHQSARSERNNTPDSCRNSLVGLSNQKEMGSTGSGVAGAGTPRNSTPPVEKEGEAFRFDRFAMDHLTARKILQGQHHHHHRGARPSSPRMGHRSPGAGGGSGSTHLSPNAAAQPTLPPSSSPPPPQLRRPEFGSPSPPPPQREAVMKQRRRSASGGAEDEKIALLSCAADFDTGSAAATGDVDCASAVEKSGGITNSTSVV